MGGGVGISAYGSLRLVTERSRVAMPETAIGFFPDVGALYLLSRAPGELGTHLALTGATVGGADAVVLGLADALVDSADLPAIRAALAEGAGPDVVDALRREGDAAAGRDSGRGSTSATPATTPSWSSRRCTPTPRRQPARPRPRCWPSGRRCRWRSRSRRSAERPV